MENHQITYEELYAGEEDARKRPMYPAWVEALKESVLFFPLQIALEFFAFERAGGQFGTLFSYTLVFLLVPILDAFQRRKFGNFIVFAIFFFLCWLYAFRCSDLSVRVGGIVMSACLTIYSGYRSVSKADEQPISWVLPIVTMIFLILLYTLAVKYGQTSYQRVLLLQGVLMNCLYLFYLQRVNMLDTMRAIDKGSNFSTKKVMWFNTGMFAVFALLLLTMCVLLYELGLANWLKILADGLLLGLRWIVRHLFHSNGEEGQVSQQLQDDIQEQLEKLRPEQKTSLFLIILERIVTVLAVVGAILAVAYIIVHFVRQFRGKANYQSLNFTEEKSFTQEERPPRRRRPRLFDFSPENQIRREYYRKVRGKIDKEVSRADTPEQVSRIVPETCEIIPRYEAVRYGTREKRRGK